MIESHLMVRYLISRLCCIILVRSWISIFLMTFRLAELTL